MSETHAIDGGTVSAPPANAAFAQLSHQEPPPPEAAASAHEGASGGSEHGKGDKVDKSA